MSGKRLARLTVDQLLQRFIEIGEKRHFAKITNDSRRYNRYVDQTWAVYTELASRGDEARDKILPLMDHRNPGVRLAAAGVTMYFAPELGKAGFERLVRDRNPGNEIESITADLYLSMHARGELIHKPE